MTAKLRNLLALLLAGILFIPALPAFAQDDEDGDDAYEEPIDLDDESESTSKEAIDVDDDDEASYDADDSEE